MAISPNFLAESSMPGRTLPLLTRFLPRLACVALLLSLNGATASADSGRSGAAGKLDTNLRALAARGADSTPQQVIIRLKPGAETSVRALLRSRGDKALRFHAGINAFTASARNLAALARDER